MNRWRAQICLLMLCVLTACSTPAPTWRARASALVDELARQNAQVLFPQEYLNLLEAFEHGEAVLHVQGDDRASDVFYLMAMQKGALLKDEVVRRKLRIAQEERERIAAEAARVEEERLMLEAVKAEERLREQDRRDASPEAQAAAAEALRESSLQKISSYTVRRGETLPQIAARTEIFNDYSLWPLIYRANRDQIRDPKQLWPGQVLKIPRHFSRDDALEAKRYSGKK